MLGTATHRNRAVSDPWDTLHAQACALAAGLTGPRPGAHGLCRTCRGPAAAGPAAAGPGRCFQCRLHAESAPGSLADVVVPVAFAPKGGTLARYLWQYKSGQPEAGRARHALRILLLVFLRDHGACVWRSAGMPVPTHVSVVPSGRGRTGPHPLASLVLPYLARPVAPLVTAGPQPPGWRDLDPARFRAPAPLPGAAVLLLDDTWTSGSSAQSAAAALRAAAARHVPVVVLGRHLSPGGRALGSARQESLWRPLRLDCCAVHPPCWEVPVPCPVPDSIAGQ